MQDVRMLTTEELSAVYGGVAPGGPGTGGGNGTGGHTGQGDGLGWLRALVGIVTSILG